MLGGGSSLVGGTLKTEILREEVLELALDGFLPECELDDQPKEEEKSPYREIGLPYVSDPAVTRHLAAFLKSAGTARTSSRPGATGSAIGSDGPRGFDNSAGTGPARTSSRPGATGSAIGSDAPRGFDNSAGTRPEQPSSSPQAGDDLATTGSAIGSDGPRGFDNGAGTKPEQPSSSPQAGDDLATAGSAIGSDGPRGFDTSVGGAKPDAILFNGGFFIPEVLRQRVADVMEHWYGRRPADFRESRSGSGGGGGRRILFVCPRDRRRAAGAGRVAAGLFYRARRRRDQEKLRTLCLVPRGAEEGSTIEFDPGTLQLIANKPVSFRLYSSRTRTEDKPGDVVEFERGDPDLHLHAPLHAVLRFGKAGERMVPVKLGARLTEVGTLEIWADSKVSDHRWRLQFELRKAASAEAAGVLRR